MSGHLGPLGVTFLTGMPTRSKLYAWREWDGRIVVVWSFRSWLFGIWDRRIGRVEGDV